MTQGQSTQPKIESLVRAIPDFPKPGILFRDISPLLAHPDAFRETIAQMAHLVKAANSEVVIGLESRGFIFGVPIAQALNIPFIPARKAGKLPGDVHAVTYSLEYGTQSLEMQKDAFRPGSRAAIVDDLLATGGTAKAASELVGKVGGIISGYFFAIELEALRGRVALNNAPVESILKYS